MRRQWHIRTRLLVTLAGLTTAALLAVALAFNLSVRTYIQRRVAAQLDSVVFSETENRRGGKKGGRPFDGQWDRITGTQANAASLSGDGTLLSVLHGDPEVCQALADYFRDGQLRERVEKKLVSLPGGKYMVSVTPDPQREGAYLLYYVDITSLSALTAQVNTVLAVIVLGAIALSVLLSRRFARSFAEPVQRLSAFAREIGGGNFSQQALSFRDTEFSELADSMNQMARELSEANQKQEAFFQNVSHELRTPLTSIRGNAEGIVFGVMEPQAAGQVILSESDKLSGMVEDILTLSRMNKGVPEGSCPPIDLREVLSLCVSEQRTEAERRGLVFSFAFDEEPVLFPIREQDAHHLFGNLISNAIRYAHREITLTCRSASGGVTAAVGDDGPGIAAEDLPHIFERFYKGAGGKHGIGLSIVRSVVDAYHGEISVDSGNGARFTVRFS